MRRLDAPALAATKGARLAAALAALPGVASVRGRGLLLAAELEAGDAAGGVPPAARRRPGRRTPSRRPRCALAPPLTVTDDEIDEAVGA